MRTGSAASAAGVQAPTASAVKPAAAAAVSPSGQASTLIVIEPVGGAGGGGTSGPRAAATKVAGPAPTPKTDSSPAKFAAWPASRRAGAAPFASTSISPL